MPKSEVANSQAGKTATSSSPVFCCHADSARDADATQDCIFLYQDYYRSPRVGVSFHSWKKSGTRGDCTRKKSPREALLLHESPREGVFFHPNRHGWGFCSTDVSFTLRAGWEICDSAFSSSPIATRGGFFHPNCHGRLPFRRRKKMRRLHFVHGNLDAILVKAGECYDTELSVARHRAWHGFARETSQCYGKELPVARCRAWHGFANDLLIISAFKYGNCGIGNLNRHCMASPAGFRILCCAQNLRPRACALGPSAYKRATGTFA